MTEYSQKERLAQSIKFLAADAVQKANSGHPGMPMGMSDVTTVLFSEHLKFVAEHPEWPDRDRFVLSAGHGSMLLYAVLYLTGYEHFTLDQLKSFRQLHSHTPGHPEYEGKNTGIETTTGPLGQGLANAVGMAIAEKKLCQQFGKNFVDHHTYVIAGDGCLMEGISHEAISLAGHLKLNKLIVLFDDNHISIDGDTDLAVSDNIKMRFQACGWDVQNIDGHNHNDISEAIRQAKLTQTPSLIACRTVIGKGAPKKAGTASVHGSPLGAEEIQQMREALDWPYGPFEIPDNLLSEWRKIGKKGSEAYYRWKTNLEALDNESKTKFEDTLSCNIKTDDFNKEVSYFKETLVNEPVAAATRKSSEICLNFLNDNIPFLIGGSADLTGSNNTKAASMKAIEPDDFSGQYIHYGVREHAMGAVLNGLALHGGAIAYGGTFLTFTDYCRPAIRLSALMKQPVVYVMTHDSIGLGEDGPTHQPIEHLASLRAIPNLFVLRPADQVETLEAWQIAIQSKTTPSIIVLSRQSLPQMRLKNEEENLTHKGAYVLYESPKVSSGKKVSLYASGSEVHVALEAIKKLEKKGFVCKLVSVPCWELFDEQEVAYKKQILEGADLRVSIEAAHPMGWEKFVGDNGIMMGIKTFGASAPASDLFTYFGITAEDIMKNVTKFFENG